MVFNHNVILVLCKISFHKSMLKCSAGYELGWLCYQILWSPLGFPLESEGMITYRPRKVLLSHLKGEWMVSTLSKRWAHTEQNLVNGERMQSASGVQSKQTLMNRHCTWTQECGKINDLYWVPRELSLHYVSR